MADDPTDDIETQVEEIVSAETDRQAAALRIAGLTYQQIADRLGYANPSGAFKAVERAFADIQNDPTDRIRQLELSRLDDMLVGLWVAARGGNGGAIDRVLKIMERRARLLGLDQSTDTAGSATGQPKGGSDLDRARAARANRRSRASS